MKPIGRQGDHNPVKVGHISFKPKPTLQNLLRLGMSIDEEARRLLSLQSLQTLLTIQDTQPLLTIQDTQPNDM